MSPRAAFLAGALVFLVGAAGLTAAVVHFGGAGGETARQASAVGGPFSLVDQDGKQVTEADVKGKPTLVFFGFTRCPDVCPTALYEITQALAALGPDAAKAQALFVTVDPERDTPDALKAYLSSFAPQIRGLTGSPEQVTAMVKAYRAYAKKQPTKDGDYTMDHTAIVYLMDRNGAFVAPLDVKRPPEQIAAEIRRYV
ncbi:SCO family protein [Hansschlegelia zhihuaiae]|uniref:SCO family protein n=1 Tax=Hansschlegelia zhihuaiae TaxID=405005 RepID=A0A4Q0M2J8_9HYPH|nr:SCO family protein [Hansschlegelia zhihuaiae]RXF67110.1 SCO family protein [Hansschlegelia zhihuaiae]